MKFHTTKDKYKRVTYYATRKEAIKVLNGNRTLFPNAIGCHYELKDLSFDKQALVALINRANR
tara:strand:- start:485 stop:673 length:189 start_codon:yes stop_codon:yes gene_type:complete